MSADRGILDDWDRFDLESESEREPDEDHDDCGRMPDGTCLRAGSEECDFECRYRGRW